MAAETLLFQEEARDKIRRDVDTPARQEGKRLAAGTEPGRT